jgi:hypothetical protein
LGGKDGVLISPEDPNTIAKLDELLLNSDRHSEAAGYVERVKFTPPELRDEFHQRALERWPEIRNARNRQRVEKGIQRPEPSPAAQNQKWKKWLKETRSLPRYKGNFIYLGIPLVGQGYLNVHIDGAKAILSHLTPNTKGSITRTPLRDAFIRAAALLLCVPGRYMRVLDGLSLKISKKRSHQFYDPAQFGNEHQLDLCRVAQYLASIGTTANEAEQWRPWAAAYVDMHITTYPNSTHAQDFQRARERARENIRDDPIKWVLNQITVDAPGHYDPRSTPSQNASDTHITTPQPEISNVEAEPFSTMPVEDTPMQHDTSDTVDEDTVSLGSEDGWGDDDPMGAYLG